MEPTNINKYDVVDKLIQEHDGILTDDVINEIHEYIRQYCITEYYTAKFKSAKEISFTLKDIPREYHSFGVCMTAIKRDFENLKYINDRDKNYYENEYYRNMVISDWRNLMKIPNDKKNVYICYNAFIGIPESHQYIPEYILRECYDMKNAYDTRQIELIGREQQLQQKPIEQSTVVIQKTPEEIAEIKRVRDEKKINEEQNKITKGILQCVIENIGKKCISSECEEMRKNIKETIVKNYSNGMKVDEKTREDIIRDMIEKYK